MITGISKSELMKAVKETAQQELEIVRDAIKASESGMTISEVRRQTGIGFLGEANLRGYFQKNCGDCQIQNGSRPSQYSVDLGGYLNSHGSKQITRRFVEVDEAGEQMPNSVIEKTRWEAIWKIQ